jgi:hypothetical protein
MKGRARRKAPEVILREGKPSAVILDIDEYKEGQVPTEWVKLSYKPQ